MLMNVSEENARLLWLYVVYVCRVLGAGKQLRLPSEWFEWCFKRVTFTHIDMQALFY